MSNAHRQEELLAKCAAVLRVETLSGRDNFFGVGGDSLDAVELAEILTVELGREIEFETVMRSTTFAALLEHGA